MKVTRNLLLLTLVLTCFAGGLRFLRLGAYPLASDEQSTIYETQAFLQKRGSTSASQIERLPRLIPIAYTVHAIDYYCFGQDEFGSRILMAILGTASVVAVHRGLAPDLQPPTALAASLLVATWPEHVFNSQLNRFYITAWFFSSLCMILGAQALQLWSERRMVYACFAAIVSLLTHTLLAFLLPGLFLATLLTARSQHRSPLRLLSIIAIFGLVAAGIVLSMIRTGSGWNGGAAWGYGLARSLMASISQLGWPMFVLACLGALWMLQEGSAQSVYWLTWAVLYLLASLTLPLFVVYHPAYVFPLTPGVIIVAGYAVASVARTLRATDAFHKYSWIIACSLLQFPGLVSHYRDGSRYDMRTAAHFVGDHWSTGDRLVAVSPALVQHYLAFEAPVIPLAGDYLPTLRQAAAEDGRLWIVIPSGRGGKPEQLRRWLASNCSQELLVRKPRVDYYDFIVEVFLYDPHGTLERPNVR